MIVGLIIFGFGIYLGHIGIVNKTKKRIKNWKKKRKEMKKGEMK